MIVGKTKPTEEEVERKRAIGQRIKKYRIEAGLSRKQLGKLVGAKYQTVAAWENDQRPDPVLPRSSAALARVARALGKSTTDLTGEASSDPPSKKELVRARLEKKATWRRLEELSTMPQDELREAIDKIVGAWKDRAQGE